jgi:hypothetical protein
MNVAQLSQDQNIHITFNEECDMSPGQKFSALLISSNVAVSHELELSTAVDVGTYH